MNAWLNLIAVAEPAAEGNVAERIVDTFHIHWGPFIAQCISVLIVALLLKKFAFQPVQQMLEQRRARIAEGEEKLKRIEQQLADSEKTTAAAIAKANEEAQRLIGEARDSATALSEAKAQEAVAQAQQIITKAEAAAKAEREQIAAELKKEFGRLVTATTAQVTGKVLTAEDQQRINQEALTKVES